MAKPFATLNTRLRRMRCHERMDRQGLGFRNNQSCGDHSLSLLIEQLRSEKGGKLYACFVDFTKANDTLPDNLLRRKEYRNGWMIPIYVVAQTCAQSKWLVFVVWKGRWAFNLCPGHSMKGSIP